VVLSHLVEAVRRTGDGRNPSQRQSANAAVERGRDGQKSRWVMCNVHERILSRGPGVLARSTWLSWGNHASVARETAGRRDQYSPGSKSAQFG